MRGTPGCTIFPKLLQAGALPCIAQQPQQSARLDCQLPPPSHCHCPHAAIVKKHGTALAVAAKDWIQQYKDNRTRATAELLTFIIQASCGAQVAACRPGCVVEQRSAGRRWHCSCRKARMQQGRNGAQHLAPLDTCWRVMKEGIQIKQRLKHPQSHDAASCLRAGQVCGTEEEITEDELEELEVDQVKASLDERAQEVGAVLRVTVCGWSLHEVARGAGKTCVQGK